MAASSAEKRLRTRTPRHRIYVGRAEIGAAWSRRSEEEPCTFSLKLDDPSFNAPIYANLFDDEGERDHPLARGGRENWLRLAPDRPARFERAGLREDGQSRPRRTADETAPRQAKTSRQASEGTPICDIARTT